MSLRIDVARKPDRPISAPLPVSISEIVSPLTSALDLGKGRVMGHSVRTCVLGMRLANEIGLPQNEHCDLYYALLMKDAGSSVARRMGLSEAAAATIGSLGEPGATHLPARIVQFAQTLEVSYFAGGPAAAQRARFPELVLAAESLAARDALWIGIEDASERVIELEPMQKPFEANETSLDNICQAFGEVIDGKTSLSSGHSIGVAGTAVLLARALGLSESEITLLRRAALLHDIGKLGVPNEILEKPGPLTNQEWAALRRHVVYSYQILKRVPGFEDLSELAGSHHEKLDGSGYFRGLKGEQLSMPMRILAVADIYDALTSKRPYRDALPQDLAFEIMKQQAPHALDATCLEALLGSLHHETSNAAGLARLSANLQHSFVADPRDSLTGRPRESRETVRHPVPQ